MLPSLPQERTVLAIIPERGWNRNMMKQKKKNESVITVGNRSYEDSCWKLHDLPVDVEEGKTHSSQMHIYLNQ